MFEFVSRWAVELGYLAVAVNAALMLRRLKGELGFHRTWAIWVMVAPAVFWFGFYLHVAYGNSPNLPAWSRIGHTITFAAFIAQQYLITAGHRSRLDQVSSLENYLITHLLDDDE